MFAVVELEIFVAHIFPNVINFIIYQYFANRILHITHNMCSNIGQFFLIYAIVAAAAKRLRSNCNENESRLQSSVIKWARTRRKWENPLGTLNIVTTGNEHRFISSCAHIKQIGIIMHIHKNNEHNKICCCDTMILWYNTENAFFVKFRVIFFRCILLELT